MHPDLLSRVGGKGKQLRVVAGITRRLGELLGEILNVDITHHVYLIFTLTRSQLSCFGCSSCGLGWRKPVESCCCNWTTSKRKLGWPGGRRSEYHAVGFLTPELDVKSCVYVRAPWRMRETERMGETWGREKKN